MNRRPPPPSYVELLDRQRRSVNRALWALGALTVALFAVLAVVGLKG